MASAADKSCAVCLAESAQDPRQVPCGNSHVFCLSCLEGLVAHAQTVQDNSFPCPTCRNRVDIPARGVAAFPTLDKAGSPQPANPFSPPHRYVNRPFPRRRRPPGFAEDRGPVAYPVYPFPLVPARPRRVNTPFHARARDPFDLEMDSPEAAYPNGYHLPPLPVMLPRPYRRVLEPREGQRFRGRPAEPPRGFVDHSDDLDMEEVMLVIAEMEEQEKLKLAQEELEQDEMLRLHCEVNEEEDRLDSLLE